MTSQPSPIHVPEEVQPLPDGLVEGLAAPAAYPLDRDAPQGVASLQTHISHLFLTAKRVYKLRKAVRPEFLDFSTRCARNDDCLREVALNRRLAPEVYLGVAPVRVKGGVVTVGPVRDLVEAPELEHCVVMRRLPPDRDALSLLQHDRLREDHVDAIARTIAAFHREQALGAPAPFSPGEWLDELVNPVEANFDVLGEQVSDDRPSRLAFEAREFLRRHAARLEVRRRDGRAVDGHGDLHLAHAWFHEEGRDPVFIDCIEFDDRLRRIDAACEVAFLAMDLAYRGKQGLAERFLRRYACDADDFQLYGVVDYFVSYRAAVRAKVAAMAGVDGDLSDEQRRAASTSADRHLGLALEALAPRTHGSVIVMTGIVGTGKSTAAEGAADGVEGVVISSDRVRKHLAGLDPLESASARVGRGIYTAEHTKRVYDGLLERAAPVVASGRPAVLDATFSRPTQREAASRFARRRNVPFLIVETRCPAEVVLRRLAERQRTGGDPSDAGPSFYEESVARFAPVEVPRGGAHVVIDTDGPSWPEDLASRLRAWRVGVA